MSSPTRKPQPAKAPAPTPAPKAPEIPAIPVPEVPAAPAAAAADGEAKKKKREEKPSLFDSAEVAIAEAASREKGPRKPFKVTSPDGTEYFVVHNNEGRALGVAAKKAGWTAEALGEKATRAKPVTLESLMAQVNSLPEDQRSAVVEQLKQLKQ